MVVSAVDFITYSGPVFDLCLLSIIAAKSRWRKFPAFSALIAFDLVFSTLVLGFGVGLGRLSYSIIDSISVILQLAVVYELFRAVLPSSGSLAAKGRKLFTFISLLGLALAGTGAFLIRSPTLHGAAAVEAQVDLFASLLICETVIAIMLAAQQIGMGWRNHLIAVAQGLMVWSLSIVAIEGIGPYLPHDIANKTYYVRSIIYVITLGYWCVALWREEPERKPISAAMQKYIVALHDRVQYDFSKVGH